MVQYDSNIFRLKRKSRRYVSIILVKLELNVSFEGVMRYINKSFGKSVPFRTVVVYYGTYVSTLWTTSNITSNIYHVCTIYFMHNLYNIRYAFRIERRQKIKSEVKIEFEIHTTKTKSRTAKTKSWRKHLVIFTQTNFSSCF